MEIQLVSNISNFVATFGFCLVGFLGVLGGIASVLGGLLTKKKSPDIASGLLGLGSALFGGASKSSAEKAAYKKFMERMNTLKPTKAYSGGVDPVIEAAIANTFANRGMSNPYAQTGGQAQQASPQGQMLGGMTRDQYIERRMM